MSGGSTFKKTTSILSRAREITELEEIIKKLKNNSQKLVDELEEYKKTSTEALEQFDTNEKNMQEVNSSFATETEKMSSIDSNIERMNKKIEILNQEQFEKIQYLLYCFYDYWNYVLIVLWNKRSFSLRRLLWNSIFYILHEF